MKNWLSSLPAETPLAVVTASSVNALSFVRGLGRRGVPVVLLDSDRHLAVHSRYAKVVRLPGCRAEPGAWLDELESIGRSLKRPGVLLPTADPHVSLLAENRAALEPFFRFPTVPAQLATDLISKRFQAMHAERLGVPTPLTRTPASREEAGQAAQELDFPCILKPDFSQSGARSLSGRKLLIVESPRELLKAWDDLHAEGISCIVQEVVPGPDTALVSYLGFWDEDGRERAFITKRKLRQFPALYGNGSIQRTEDLPDVADYSRRLLEALGYRGFAGIEFKEDSRDGSLRFVEINPRSSAMNELAVAAGVDFPWIAYSSLAGLGVEKTLPVFRTGVTCVNEEWDVQAYLERSRKGEITFSEWRKSLRGAHRIIADRDDPKPFLAGLFRGVRRVILGGRGT